MIQELWNGYCANKLVPDNNETNTLEIMNLDENRMIN